MVNKRQLIIDNGIEKDDNLFIEANEYVKNEALNDDDQYLNDEILDEKGDQLIEKLKSLNGKKRFFYFHIRF
jgi:hypothetical protein